MIVVATSAANHCHYCVVAHGAIPRIYTKNPLIADQIATNYLKADLSARERAILDLALKVFVENYKLGDADFAIPIITGLALVVQEIDFHPPDKRKTGTCPAHAPAW